MMAAIERRATVSTQVRSPELPYSGYPSEYDDIVLHEHLSHRMYPIINGNLSNRGFNIGLHRFASHGGVWAYAPDQSSATALSLVGDAIYDFIELDHYFPSAVSAAKASTSLDSGKISSELLRCLSSVYALEAANHHRAASKVIFRFVEENFAASDLAAVNFLLARAELARLSVWSISGLLRVTARAKDWLPLWSTRFQEAKKTLASQGVNTTSLFAGL